MKIGIFMVQARNGCTPHYGYGPHFEEFSYHYFNDAGHEVGMQHVAFPDHCQVFFPPRVWADSFKQELLWPAEGARS